ncbi:class I SAM-dependent methyltransferase [bacterium]|nr:class I SAM-dependent methyltransferase [bacterium]MBU4511039.1 class I SAM-dependent methyltransferase [bacterium]
MLNDIKIYDAYWEINKRRVDYFIPNYLAKFINKRDKVCSVGCGTGYDVELLNNMGHDTYGFDLGNRTLDWINRSPKIQEKLKKGFAEDLPFGKGKFDFVYATEVIEHVGCKDAIWELLDNYYETRVKFLSSCLEMLKPNGRLLLSTSNRLFPIDFGHVHYYNKFTDFMASKGNINITIPWHSKNFTLSFGDFLRLLKKTKYEGLTDIKQLSSFKYPSNSKQKYRRIVTYIINGFLLMLSFYPLIRFNPIMVVIITKNRVK